jgi:hypothetical protein
MSDLKESLAYAFRPATVWRALRVSAVIGTLLAAINHYDDWLRGETMSVINLFQIGLTYLVPYIVSIHGQVYGNLNR